jgi:hypothetical protein
MGGRGANRAIDLYGRGDAIFKDVDFRGFSLGIPAGAIGFTHVIGDKTFLDNVTNIVVTQSKHELIIELDEGNFGRPDGRNIVFKLPDNFDPTNLFRPKALWRRPGKPTLQLWPVGAVASEPTVSIAGLINAVASALPLAQLGQAEAGSLLE